MVEEKTKSTESESSNDAPVIRSRVFFKDDITDEKFDTGAFIMIICIVIATVIVFGVIWAIYFRIPYDENDKLYLPVEDYCMMNDGIKCYSYAINNYGHSEYWDCENAMTYYDVKGAKCTS